MPSRTYNNWEHPPTGSRGYGTVRVWHVDAVQVETGVSLASVTFVGSDYSAGVLDTPERLADMLRFALAEVTALLPADTPPPAEPVPYFRRPVPFDIGDEADIDTVTEADWDDVLTDRFGGEAA